jgi:hypothetical protein
MSTPTATAPGSNVLGRYTTPQGGRKLCARVKDGQTFLTDEPVSGRGPIYPIDVVPFSDGLDGLDAVQAIVDLYLKDARSSCSIPMAHTILDADLAEAAA